MSKHNLTQAAKLAGISRSTLMRHLQEGKISKALDRNGKPCIDTAELQRVYGALSQSDSITGQSVNSHRTPENGQNDTPDSALSVEVAALRERLTDKDDVIADLRKRLDLAAEEQARLTRLLTDQRPPAPPQKPAGWPWKLFR